MDISKLLYVTTVADTKNLAEAADRLGVTRQAVSKSIRRLEQEVRAKLFNQVDGQFVPTNIGMNFINHARTIISDYDILTSEFFPQATNRPGPSRCECDHVSLAVSSEASYGIMEKLYSDYYTSEQIIFDIDITDTLHIYEDIDSLFYDCAVVLTCEEIVHRYDRLTLAPIQPAIVMPTNNRLSSKRMLTAADLDDLELVACGQRSELCRILLSACSESGSNPNVLLNVNDFDKAKEIAVNLGVSYLSISSPLKHAPDGYTKVSLHLPSLSTLGIYAIRSHSKSITSAAAHFWQTLSEYRESNIIKKYVPTA